MDQKAKYANIILRPRITEKATDVTENSVYAFEVSDKSTKQSIAKAVHAYFGVNPIKVRTVTLPAKRVIVRGRRGVKAGVKKAYVYLKKGETINLA